MGQIQEALNALVNRIAPTNTQQNAAPPKAIERGYDSRIPDEETYRNPGVTPEGPDTRAVVNNPYLNDLYEWQQMMGSGMSADAMLHYGEYLPRGTAATNVNRKSPEETLRLSRMADALNNRYYRSPRKIDDRSATYGGGESGQTADFGHLYQMPIETEEMRQMQRTRDYESQVRGREIGRQQTAQDFQALETRRNEFHERLRLSGKYNDEEIRRFMQIWDYQYGYYDLRRQTAFMRANHVYTTTFDRLHVPQAQADAVMRLMQGGNSPAANMLAVLFGVSAGAPTYQQIAMDRVMYQNFDMNNLQQSLRNMTRQNMELVVDQAVEVVGRSSPEGQRIIEAFKETYGGR